MTSISKIALACAALVAASGAFAQKAGDNIASVGLASINPNVSLDKMTSVGPGSTGAYFTGKLVDANASVSNQTTVSMGLLHMFTNEIGGEFTIGIPAEFTQDMYMPNGSAPQSHPAAAKMKIWTPTAVAKYFFGTTNDQWRPYVGFGVSRVSFHNVSTNSTDTTVAALASTSADFSSSWAPVYNAGVIYNVDEKWSINGSVSYIPIKTTATFVGPAVPGLGLNGPVTTTGDAKLNTMDYVIRLGYRF